MIYELEIREEVYSLSLSHCSIRFMIGCGNCNQPEK